MKLEGSKLLSRSEIQALISKGLNYVYFSKKLEAIYKQQYQNEAALELQWFSLYAWVGVIILAAWLLSLIKKLNRFFDFYTCIGSTAAVAISFIIFTIMGDNNNALFHAAMMYAVIIIYGFVGMRFYTAVIAGWSGGLIAIAVTIFLNYPIDWTFLNRTYTFSSFLGMALAYAIDRQHRENYLQNCIIALNQLEMSKQSEQLELLSQLDSLTGLANRRHLSEVLEQQWRISLRYQMPVSILMVDIDFFKEYNDHLGHLAGDLCLQKIAHELKNLTSRSNDLAARYGGEEFLLLFPMLNEDQIELLAKKLMQRILNLALPHPASPISAAVTVSIGAATVIPQELDTIPAFIQRADEALYHAKSSGRNQYCMSKKAAA